MREPLTPFGKAIEMALTRRWAEAENQWFQASEVQETITREQFRAVFNRIGRPLTFRLWYLAIEEAEKLAR